jgi:hypothetical protein
LNKKTWTCDANKKKSIAPVQWKQPECVVTDPQFETKKSYWFCFNISWSNHLPKQETALNAHCFQYDRFLIKSWGFALVRRRATICFAKRLKEKRNSNRLQKIVFYSFNFLTSSVKPFPHFRRLVLLPTKYFQSRWNKLAHLYLC